MRRHRWFQPRARALRAFRNDRFRRAGSVLPAGAKEALAFRPADGRRSQTDRIIEAALEADIWTAGFPCQDISTAGKRAGLSGSRSGLWSEIRRAIGLARPPIVILENVANLLSGERGAWMRTILGDFAALGYDAEWHTLSASYFGLPQARERVFIVAYIDEQRCKSGQEWDSQGPFAVVRNHDDGLALAQHRAGQATSEICRMDDGLPNGLDRLRALGNAIVPQAAEMLGVALKRWLR